MSPTAEWRAVNEALAEAIPDHPTRIAVVRLIVTARVADHAEMASERREMDRRLEIALAGTAAMTPEEIYDAVTREETKP